MKTNKITHAAGTLTCCNGTETTVSTITADFLELPEILCPACSTVAEAHPGSSSGWFTGHREYYNTYVVSCPKCHRAGYPAYYKSAEQAEKSLELAVDSFLREAKRPITAINPV